MVGSASKLMNKMKIENNKICQKSIFHLIEILVWLYATVTITNSVSFVEV